MLALFFGISILFSSATIIITPKIEKISFNNDTYTTKLNSLNQEELSFEILTFKKSDGEIIEATEEKDVSQKASGKIVIYNNYSTAPQRLINNTRFEANNGKIYRINSSVIVPGIKKVDNKVVPGSVEAVVYADQAGVEYNLKVADLTGDFKIPGFKGDPRYNSFYGLIKTDILGGFVGKQRIVSEDVRKAAEALIKTRLNESLIKELYAIKPENYLIFKDGYSIEYIALPDISVDTNKVKVNLEGEINGVVFNNIKLSKYLANKKIEKFDGLPTELIPSDNLVTTFITKDNIALAKSSVINLKLNGDANIKWLYNSDDIKRDLAGTKESAVQGIISKYKDSLISIQVIFSPIWTRYFPDNLNKIKVKEAVGLDY